MDSGRLISASVLAVLCAGCVTLGEPHRRPAVQAPPAWQGKVEDRLGWPESDWWKRFGSSELDGLIELARQENHDLKAAAARVAQGRANARIAAAELFPLLTVGAEAGRSKSGREPSNAAYSFAPQVSYELDIWGKNRYARDAGEAGLLFSTYDRDTVALTLQADVAIAYFLILSLKDRLRVAQESAANARKLLGLIETQRHAGKVSALEVERQRTQLAVTEAAIPVLLRELQVAHDALAVLLGRNPGEVPVREASLRPRMLPAVGAGVPAELLERRPDIRRAEADLAAANANVGAARAAVYPSLIVSGAGGFRGAHLASLFSSATGFYSLAASLLATIFDGGARAGKREFAEARRVELVEAYYRSVVSAFREVEDALAGIEQFASQERLQQEAVIHAREAYRLAEIRYRAGAADFTTVLDAQRALLTAEAAIDPIRFARFASTVQLYRALGGGWEDPARPAEGRARLGLSEPR